MASEKDFITVTDVNGETLATNVDQKMKCVEMDQTPVDQNVIVPKNYVVNIWRDILHEMGIPVHQDMTQTEIAHLCRIYFRIPEASDEKLNYKIALKDVCKRAKITWREHATGFRAKAVAAAEAVAATARSLRRVRLCCIKSEKEQTVTESRDAAAVLFVVPGDAPPPASRYFVEGDSLSWMAKLRGNVVVKKIDYVKMEFKVDAANKTSGISKRCYDEVFNMIPIEKRDGLPAGASEFITVTIEWGQTAVPVELFLHSYSDRPLTFGRDWMESQVCAEYPEVFSDSSVQGQSVHKIALQLKDDMPVLREARSLPAPLQDCVASELHRLEREGTIYKLTKSEYGTPIIPIVKKNGKVTICPEYNTTINPKIQEINYRVPKVALVCAALHEGQHFTRLDLSDAYKHMVLEEESQRFTAISTHIGIYAYRRVPFGLKGTLGCLQVILESLLKGLKFAIVLDDIWVTGRHWEEHLNNLRDVLDKLRDGGFRINRIKCDFFGESLRYVGYGMNKYGLYVDQSRLNAITDAPRPKSASDLTSFLGLVNYYRKFCLDCYCILKPLYSLLDGSEWKWDDECETAFTKIKAVLTSFLVSAIFVEELPLVLTVASGPSGLGAVLSHIDACGDERPIACASRALSDSESARSRVDRGVLAVAFGVEMHRQYLYGHRFVLRTDQREISEIFSGEEKVPPALSGLLQWSVASMADYEFVVEYAPIYMNESAAVALARLPLPARFEDNHMQFAVDGDSSHRSTSHCVLRCC